MTTANLRLLPFAAAALLLFCAPSRAADPDDDQKPADGAAQDEEGAEPAGPAPSLEAARPSAAPKPASSAASAPSAGSNAGAGGAAAPAPAAASRKAPNAVTPAPFVVGAPATQAPFDGGPWYNTTPTTKPRNETVYVLNPGETITAPNDFGVAYVVDERGTNLYAVANEPWKLYRSSIGGFGGATEAIFISPVKLEAGVVPTIPGLKPPAKPGAPARAPAAAAPAASAPAAWPPPQDFSNSPGDSGGD
jgi:hypothetical protein